MNNKILLSRKITEGEYEDLFGFLMKDLKLFRRKFIFFIRSVSSNESQQYGLRYFERQYQPELISLFNENNFQAILNLPVGEVGACATQLECRYTKSGKIVGVQVIEARPHEDGRYVGLTPAKVFLDEKGEKIISFIAKMDH